MRAVKSATTNLERFETLRAGFVDQLAV